MVYPPLIATREAASSVTLATVCDDYACDPKFRVSSGFACLIRVGESLILFDTASYAPTLIHNLACLGVDPARISHIVLSHLDSDHIGGLFGILEQARAAPVYIPASSPPSFVQKTLSHGSRVIEVSEPMEVCPGVTSTGELGPWIKEQSLVVTTGKGGAVIVGCGHPGIIEIARKVRGMGQVIYLLAGGFDTGSMTAYQVQALAAELRGLGVKRVAPCHCSGDTARAWLREEFGEDFVENGAGMTMEL